ncbi:hypothetical protein QWY87_16170 [Lutimonas halocynthiae]|uniref:hypothetical protein n=1 Tax=Lutimonas halocynthiae TaxID=1446477 RepID=UPI0025B568E0|nr:hypothetical protein [Lutimonas halocynthiae]MDN3644251.1 hypothetical protein [Lutimonas halocynthiae]
MKRKHFKILILLFSFSLSSYAQQFTKPLQEFKVGSNTEVSIEASYAEIEIIEWNKNKVEIEGIMSIQGLSEDEAQDIFDNWDISAQANSDKISIRSSSSNFGNEYFFINSDKYVGNVIVDVPEISARVIDMIDSIHFVLPEFENFPDINFEMDQNFQFTGDSIAFDYDEFQKNTEYLVEWQEENKEQMKIIKKELKESQAEVAREQKKMQKEIKEIQREAMEEARLHAREAQVEMREAQNQVREERTRVVAESAREREYEVKRILENRQKVKIKKTLRIKVPRNAKLEMDVDYCKISTIK